MPDLWHTLQTAGRRDETLLPSRRRRGKTLAIVLGCVGAVLVLVLLAVGGFVWGLARTFDQGTQKIDRTFPMESTRPKVVVGHGETYLLLGSDSRSGSEGVEDAGPTGMRSDTMMVVRVDADKAAVQVMSVMRDSWVSIPGHGKAKINAAMSYGGIPLAVQTLESLIGTRIDHVALIDFEGFKDMTDALGGIDVDVPVAFHSESGAGYTFVKGNNHLDGEAALVFARERHAFKDGDYQRVRDQQAYIKAVIAKLASSGTLSNPGRVNGFISAMSPYLTVDEDLNFQELAKIGVGLRNVRPADISFFTAPTKGTARSADGQSIVELDDAKMKKLKMAFMSDSVGKYLDETRKDAQKK